MNPEEALRRVIQLKKYILNSDSKTFVSRDNVVSPVADVVRVKLQRARWANPGGASRRPTSSRQQDNTHLTQEDSRGVSSSFLLMRLYSLTPNSSMLLDTFGASSIFRDESDRVFVMRNYL